MRLTAYFIFVLSGAAGLIYESIWARYLGLFVGHAAYAQVLVLTIFMGGLAVGAMLVGSRAHRLRDPLRLYAFAELILGTIALGFHEIYLGVTGFAYDAIFPALAGGPLLTIVKWSIAGSLILPQSILLGTTFPLMAGGLLRRFKSAPGQTLSLLYFTNSLGAAVGVLVAGFYLLSLAGLPGTLLVAAMLNFLVALVAYILSHRFPLPAAAEAAPVSESPPPIRSVDNVASQHLVPLLLAVSFGTALASFVYQISWLRMLSLVLGSATHSFELMLSAFILGLALGAFWVRSRADSWKRPLHALGVVQWVMGLTALATLPAYLASFEWTAELLRTFARTDYGYTGFTLSRYFICLAVMLPSTFCAGITLPLITRTLIVAGNGERSIGAVYGFNTLGSIVGVTLAGLIALPLVGLKALLIGGAVLDMAIGVWILYVVVDRTRVVPQLAYGAAGATVFAVVVAAATQHFNPMLLASGVFRGGTLFAPGSLEVISHEDGRTATVSVTRSPGGLLTIITNGKADASLDGIWFESCSDPAPKQAITVDASTQAFAPLITLAHNPGARRAAVIGHGSGMSSHFLLTSPTIEDLVTIEIEPEMISGSRAFYPANRRVFDDPRSRIVMDDAKTYFAAAQERFDLIFSEPSNPWVSGVASLFTTEFYRHIRRYMADDGVFGQWLHLYEIDDALVLAIVGAIHENFPAYEMFLTALGDMLIVASNGSELRAPDWSVTESPAFLQDFCRVIIPTPDALEATRVSHRRALAPLLDAWNQANSDFYPTVDLLAERTRFLRSSAQGFSSLSTERFDITAPFFDRRVGLSDESRVTMASIPRVNARALSAVLRGVGDAGSDSVPVPTDFRDAIHRHEQWQNALRADRAPGDWRSWVGTTLAVEDVLGRGTAGVADGEFFASVGQFLDRHDAPQIVRDAIAFRRGLAAWDFAEVSRAADALLPGALGGAGWIPVDELVDGGVVAKLLLDDVDGAERFFEALAPYRRRSLVDLRSPLLRAYLDAFKSASPRP